MHHFNKLKLILIKGEVVSCFRRFLALLGGQVFQVNFSNVTNGI